MYQQHIPGQFIQTPQQKYETNNRQQQFSHIPQYNFQVNYPYGNPAPIQYKQQQFQIPLQTDLFEGDQNQRNISNQYPPNMGQAQSPIDQYTYYQQQYQSDPILNYQQENDKLKMDSSKYDLITIESLVANFLTQQKQIKENKTQLQNLEQLFYRMNDEFNIQKQVISNLMNLNNQRSNSNSNQENKIQMFELQLNDRQTDQKQQVQLLQQQKAQLKNDSDDQKQVALDQKLKNNTIQEIQEFEEEQQNILQQCQNLKNEIITTSWFSSKLEEIKQTFKNEKINLKQQYEQLDLKIRNTIKEQQTLKSQIRNLQVIFGSLKQFKQNIQSGFNNSTEEQNDEKTSQKNIITRFQEEQQMKQEMEQKIHEGFINQFKEQFEKVQMNLQENIQKNYLQVNQNILSNIIDQAQVALSVQFQQQQEKINLENRKLQDQLQQLRDSNQKLTNVLEKMQSEQLKISKITETQLEDILIKKQDADKALAQAGENINQIMIAQQQNQQQQQFAFILNQNHNDDSINEKEQKLDQRLWPLNQSDQGKSEITKDYEIKNDENSYLQQKIQQESSIGQNISKDQYQIKYPDPKRLKAVQDFIYDIYNQSWRKRSATGEFLKFIRDEQNLNELYRNYGIRQFELKGQLAQICNSFREVRGDGNCFYTAFGFQFFNILLYNYSLIEYQQFIQKMDEIITFKINYGEGKSIEAEGLQQYFWNEFKYRLNYLRNQNKDELIKHFQAYEQSGDNVLIDGCFYGLSTIFFRNLANYLIDHSDMNQAVLDQQNLLIWEEECNSNEVVIQELAKYLQVHVKLIFFDQGSFQLREYSQEMKSQIILLIRPGHYNIGYPNIEPNMRQY